MNLEELKINNSNVINITDALKASIVKLSIKNSENTSIPESNELIVYIDNDLDNTIERKTYVFNLVKPLNYTNGVSDEFIMEPVLDNNKVKVKTYVKRYLEDGSIEEEVLDNQVMVLFEGINYIRTNYSNALLEVIYPKDCDLVKYFLNNTIYGINSNKEILSLDDIYFKDSFTEVDDKINALFNKLTISCLDSSNHNFSLDSSGNLVVNSITTNEPIAPNTGLTIDDIYPIGSIYESVNPTNPSSIFGGTWESWGEGRVSVGVDTSQTEFNVVEKKGGEKTHKLIINEMPSHTHNAYLSGGSLSSGTGRIKWDVNTAQEYYNSVKSTGGNQPHNNLQPYITSYKWKRVA